MSMKQNTLRDIEQFTDEYMKERIGGENGAPGAAVVVVKNNDVLLKKGYGYAHIEKQMKVDPDRTLFRIGSVTKTFTAGAVMQLVEQGKIDLHADIMQYLDRFEMENPFHVPVTTHHLLTHTSGFAATPDSIPNEDLSIFVPLPSYIQSRKPVVVREPGTSFMYDNFAYNLLGYIIEQVSGKSYEQYMQEHLFKPLKMNHTHTVMREELLHELAEGYDGNTSIFPYTMEPSVLPAGGMITTAENMGHFLSAQLNGGVYEDQVLWNDATVSQMFQFQSSIHPRYPDAGYGYENWLIDEHKKAQYMVSKGGDIPGYSALMILLPEHQLGVFIVFNKLVSAALEGRQWNKRFMDHYFPATNPERLIIVRNSKEELERFEGTYTDLRLYVIQSHVTATGNGELTISDTTGKRKVKQLDPLLFIDDEGEMLAFKEELDGSILFMKYRNPVSYSKKYVSTLFDIDANSEYLPFIERMESMGMIEGRSDGQFQPEAAATRAEWTAFIGKILGMEATDLEEVFASMDMADHWAEQADDTLTREQAAHMLMSAIFAIAPFILPEDLAETAKNLHLADAEMTLSSANITALIAAGLTGPDVTIEEDGRYVFRPNEPFTRQEAAVWMNQFINLYVQMMSESE